MSDFLVV